MEATLTGTNEKEKQVLVVCVKRFGLREMHCVLRALCLRENTITRLARVSSQRYSPVAYTRALDKVFAYHLRSSHHF